MIASAPALLELDLLGGFEARVAGRPALTTGYAKLRGLLARLALAQGRPVPRDALAELLWPGMEAAAGRQNLRRALHNLKTALGEAGELLQAHRDEVRLDPDGLRLDVATFRDESADAAVRARLYRGALLEGLSIDEPGFSQWLRTERDALHRQAVALTARLAQQHEAAGRRAQAQAWAQRLRELEPGDDAAGGRAEPPLQNGDAAPPVLPGRRPVAVLYAELLAPGHDDPEEALERLRPAQARCHESLRAHGGHVMPLHGAAAFAYFGYPQAREQAARHAAEAALAAAESLPTGVALRAGLHAGFIVTDADATRPDAAGLASARALQLGQRATAGQILASADAHAQAAGYVEAQALDAQTFRLLRRTSATHRLTAARQLTPFTGRQAELARLRALWTEAQHGRPRAALLQGDAGIGKSRLVHELVAALPQAGGPVHELRCFAEYQHSPFHPLRAWIDALPAPGPGEAAPHEAVLAQMLSSRGGPEPMAAVTPSQRAAALDLLAQRLARRFAGPSLLVVEDVHWIDGSSLELLARWLAAPGPALVLMTARPGFAPPWPAQQAEPMALTPLPDAAIAAIARAVQAGLAPEAVDRVVQRADGIALFAEEIARAPAAAAVPANLADLLAARLDRLAHARATAQLAATAGREFESALLEAAAPQAGLTAERVAADLAELQSEGLLQPLAGGRWQFAHALLQEAAYESQPRAARREAHRAVAQALLQHDPALEVSQPETLARHFAGAGEAARAAGYLATAGRNALRHLAWAEARGHFEAGLALLAGLPPAPALRRVEFALQTGLGTSLHIAHGYGEPRGAAAFERAVQLADRAQQPQQAFEALWGLWQAASSRGGWSHSVAVGRELMALAAAARSAQLEQQAGYALGSALLYRGELAASRAVLERSVALEEASRSPRVWRDSYGHVTGVVVRMYLSWALWLQGEDEAASRVSEASLALARRHEAPDSLAMALVFAGVLRGWQGDFAASARIAEEAGELSRQHGLAVPGVASLMKRGWAAALQGDAGGVAMVQAAVDAIRSAMSAIAASFLATLAEAQLAVGEAQAALATADEAIAAMAQQDERYWAAAVHRMRGEALAALGRREEADAAFDEAVRIAQAQGAVALERLAHAARSRIG